MANYNLTIDGMSCQHCVRSVKTSLEAIPGVDVMDVKVGSAQIRVADDASWKDIDASIDEGGFVLKEKSVTVA